MNQKKGHRILLSIFISTCAVFFLFHKYMELPKEFAAGVALTFAAFMIFYKMKKIKLKW